MNPSSSSLPTILVSLDSGLRTASAVIAIRVGSQDEFPGNFGLAHLLEHMIFRGTLKHPSQLEFVSPFVELGAKFNGETGRDRTMYYVTSLPQELPKALSLLIEMIKQPLFDEKQLHVEKQAVMNELKTAKSQPGAFLQNELLLPNVLKEYYPKYHAPMGLAQDVEQSSFQDLLELYQSAYTVPSRIVISLHGNLQDPNQVHKMVVDLWNSIPYRMQTPSLERQLQREKALNQALSNKSNPNPPFPIQKKPHLAECFVGMAWVSAPLESFESYVLSWISAYLTGDLIACLYHELRVKRGLVYQIVSGQYGLVNTGVFSIKWQTRSCKNVPITIKLIWEKINELKDFHDEKALQTWKHWIITRFTMEKDRSINTAQLYAQQMVLTGNIRSLEQIRKLMQSITCKDVRQVASQVFSRPVTIGMLYP